MASGRAKGLHGLVEKTAEMAINWYPGHMATASRVIRHHLKHIDLVIEVRDARVIVPAFWLVYRLLLHSANHFVIGVPSSFCILLTIEKCSQIPLSSANQELQEMLARKKRLIVLNKMDLANPNMMVVC